MLTLVEYDLILKRVGIHIQPDNGVKQQKSNYGGMKHYLYYQVIQTTENSLSKAVFLP